MPIDVRYSLISLYCPEMRQPAARKDPGNEDCLIRIYLGKRRPQARARSTVNMFGLRNFQMYVDDMERIGLDTGRYATLMARTMALLHWEVKCDANDVEFVLGGARDNAGGRAVDLWMIDFNRVRAITMDAEGVRLATDAFMVNDRYYPRPLDESAMGQELWSIFETAYLDASDRLRVLNEVEGVTVDWEGLPEAFMVAVVEAQRRLLEEKEEAANRVA